MPKWLVGRTETSESAENRPKELSVWGFDENKHAFELGLSYGFQLRSDIMYPWVLRTVRFHVFLLVFTKRGSRNVLQIFRSHSYFGGDRDITIALRMGLRFTRPDLAFETVQFG